MSVLASECSLIIKSTESDKHKKWDYVWFLESGKLLEFGHYGAPFWALLYIRSAGAVLPPDIK